EREITSTAAREWKVAPESAFEVLSDDEPKGADLAFTAFDWPDPASISPRDFLYGRSVIRGYVSATVAPGGAAKTALTLTEALARAGGLPLVGEKPIRPLRVGVWNLEDDRAEMSRRLVAAASHFEDALSDTGYKQRLFLKAADESLKIARSENGV